TTPLQGYNRKRKLENYLAVVESLTETECKEHFCLLRTVADQLIDKIEQSGFIPQHSFGMKPISEKLSILMFLWLMANIEPLRTIADRFDVSISSVFRIIRRVNAWILTKLDDIITWPQNNRIQTICDQFFFSRGVPKVLGIIDCTHIRIEKPVTNANDYCNCKKYFSINLQAVVDYRMLFTNVYCGESGSLHDARVLRRSPLYNAVNENKEALFPENTFIIGDSTYPSLPRFVPPFRDNGHLTPQQTEFNYIFEFNYILSSTRMIVEKIFGLVKARFRRIKFFTKYRHISFITNVVIAACILHNYCIIKDDIFYFNFDFNNDNNHINEINDINENINNEDVDDRRRQLFNELFP
ncbi:putative nuclease HARBI1, partial [Solenopsis invicta]|uniref:putative nuclease HARBI1 n=1 Tax=Solenopsis invicta TaxID=13686 RepID=UPI00193E4C76